MASPTIGVAVGEVAKAIQKLATLWLDPALQKGRMEIKRLKKYQKACEIAEKYIITNNEFLNLLNNNYGIDEKNKAEDLLKELKKLKSKFFKYD